MEEFDCEVLHEDIIENVKNQMLKEDVLLMYQIFLRF